MKLKVPERFEEGMRALSGALRRLRKEQGWQARRNARAEVRHRLRRLRGMMDQEFPVIPKELPREKQLRGGKRDLKRSISASQRAAAFARKMARRGYSQIMNTALLTTILEAGVRVSRPPTKSGLVAPYGPDWAIFAAMDGLARSGRYNVARVREAKKSITARRALLAAKRLGAAPG